MQNTYAEVGKKKLPLMRTIFLSCIKIHFSFPQCMSVNVKEAWHWNWLRHSIKSWLYFWPTPSVLIFCVCVCGFFFFVIMTPNHYLNSLLIYIILFLMSLITGVLLFANPILALSLCGHVQDASLFSNSDL